MDYIDFKNYLEEYNAQAKINKLAKLYKGRRIALYGAGIFCRAIFENYDLSALNIVAIADAKFADPEKRSFFGLNCIESMELGKIDCDVILISNYDYKVFLTKLDDHIIYLTKNEKVPIRPLIKPDFKDLFLKKQKSSK